MIMDHSFETILDVVRYKSVDDREKRAFVFLSGGEKEEASLTYSELELKARMVAALLQEEKAKNQPVLLLYPPGLSYITAFLGCLFAGAIAVPTYFPGRTNIDLRVASIIKDSGAKIALANSYDSLKIEQILLFYPELKSVRLITTDNLSQPLADRWKMPKITSDTIAFLQYTSGSTTSPRGVMISHANLIHNLSLIKQFLFCNSGGVGVSWLPFYHDLGLIGVILECLFTSMTCVLMSPVSFIQKPFRWLHAISHYQATHTAAPNFAYNLCIKKITEEQKKNLNLSSLQVCINGAEPINCHTLKRFTEAFFECGFRLKNFVPAYGLAESTLYVSGTQRSSGPLMIKLNESKLGENKVELLEEENQRGVLLVGCGKIPPTTNIKIVDPQNGTVCLDREIGEIWISSQSTAKGYWRRHEETNTTFWNRLSGENGLFLRTGDLGFIYEEELFVTGRIKDIIIVRGHNHYPQDIESTVEQCHPAIKNGCCAAFSISIDEEEKLIVAAELNHHYYISLPKREEPENMNNNAFDEIFDTIRRAVSEQHELQVYGIVLLTPNTLPKTSSGKLQRHLCARYYLDGTLKAVKKWCLNTLKTEIFPNQILG